MTALLVSITTKFNGDTVVGLITNDDEWAYRKELAVGSLVVYTQPGPKHQKDQEDGERLQKDLLPAPSPTGY